MRISRGTSWWWFPQHFKKVCKVQMNGGCEYISLKGVMRRRQSVFYEGQNPSGVLWLNLDQMTATFPAETFLVTPDLCCGTSAFAYLNFTLCGPVCRSQCEYVRGRDMILVIYLNQGNKTCGCYLRTVRHSFWCFFSLWGHSNGQYADR